MISSEICCNRLHIVSELLNQQNVAFEVDFCLTTLIKSEIRYVLVNIPDELFQRLQVIERCYFHILSDSHFCGDNFDILEISF